MEITPERWREIKGILEVALETSPEERGALVEDLPAVGEPTKEYLKALLEVEEDAAKFLEEPAFSLEPNATNGIHAGARIGHYEIIRLLDRGGMGLVFLASRADDFAKRVALKVIKRGMDTEEIVRRFQNERQILASLDHPNIARLLDGGTTDDNLPYFAMEYVKGEPIDEFCDSRDVSVNKKLKIFLKVCSSVQALHRNLIVHRDIKPANIIVTPEGEPKLLDFGIAKLLESDQSLALPSALDRNLMTPLYASPEQIRRELITTATDIYSLGILFYQVLAGCHPYRVNRGSNAEMARAICEIDAHRPSSIVRMRRLGENPSVFHAREAKALQQKLTGDLDAIALKAVRKEPCDRYRSVEQFADDIARHMNGRPVIARPGTFSYIAGKYIGRNRSMVALVAFVFVLILFFAATIALQLERTKGALNQAEAVTKFLERLFEIPDPDHAKGADITAREILEVGTEQINQYKESDPRLYARLAATIGQVYFNLGLYEKARPLFETCLDILPGLLGARTHPEIAAAINDVAAVLYEQGEYRDAGLLLRESLDMKTDLYGKNDPRIVNTMNNLAATEAAGGNLAEAEALYREGLAIRQSIEPSAKEELATSLLLLGTLLLQSESYDEAEVRLREALNLRLVLHGEGFSGTATVLNNLGLVLQEKGDLEASEIHLHKSLEVRRKLLGKGHPATARTETNLAALALMRGNHSGCQALARNAISVLQRLAPHHWRLSYAQSVFGGCLVDAARYEEAEVLLIDSYSALVRATSECSRYSRNALRYLIKLYSMQEDEERARGHRVLLERCK